MTMDHARLDPAQPVKPCDLTGRERHLRAAMHAMSRIGGRFAKNGRKALPFMARRRSRLLPQSVAIVDGLAAAEDLGHGVRLEITLEEQDGSGWGELVINSEGLSVILEGTLGASDGASTAMGDDLTPAARALIMRVARALATDFAAAIREEVGLTFNVVQIRSVSPGDAGESKSSDGLRVDCLFEGFGDAACIAMAISAESLEEAAREQEEPPVQQGDPRVIDSLRDVPVEVVAELGCAMLSLHRVLSLKVGEVLRLPTALEDPISVRVAGIRKFHAVPVASRGQIAIEIRGRHED
jgi:flagellar motor switch protein FliM